MENKKVKIQIKNRFLGTVIFEYEAEGNTLRETVLKAIERKVALRGADLRDADLRGADLRDADLRDADLRGADLRDADLRDADLRDADFTGSVLDYDDDPAGYGNTDNLVKKITENSNLKPTVLYENHDSYASAYGSFWRNLIIIRKWEIVEKKEEKKIQLSDEQKAIIKAFATMHETDSLKYVAQDEYGGFNLDDDKYLDFPNEIEGLTDGVEYTLAELGIE